MSTVPPTTVPPAPQPPHGSASPSGSAPSGNGFPRSRSPWTRAIGSLIFFSRWLQAPLYLGLIVAQCIYVAVFVSEIVVLWNNITWTHPDGAAIMLGVLGLIDVVMIANLLIMVIIGGYETFVSRIKTEGHPDQPEWLSHVNANVLKVKLAMAIVGISSIHLLKTFIEVAGIGPSGITVASAAGEKVIYTSEGVLWQVVIHCVFILSALALAWIDKMSQPKPSHAGEQGAHLYYPAAYAAAPAPHDPLVAPHNPPHASHDHARAAAPRATV